MFSYSQSICCCCSVELVDDAVGAIVGGTDGVGVDCGADVGAEEEDCSDRSDDMDRGIVAAVSSVSKDDERTSHTESRTFQMERRKRITTHLRQTRTDDTDNDDDD